MEPRRVLIVDQSDDMRQVLKAIFECRGWEIVEARASQQGLDLASHCCPDVIVLDLETLQSESTAASGQSMPAWQATTAPVVFLGRLPRGSGTAARRCLAKPYHYAPLLRTIEELLNRSPRDAFDDD